MIRSAASQVAARWTRMSKRRRRDGEADDTPHRARALGRTHNPAAVTNTSTLDWIVK